MNGRNRSVKPWSPSAVRRRRSEQNWRIACDCRHLQTRPGPSHHGLTEQLRSDRHETFDQLATVRFHASDIGGRGHGPPGAGRGQWASCGLSLLRCPAPLCLRRPPGWLDGLPARDHCGESDLPARGAKGRHLCPPPCRTSGQKGGVALTTSTPLVRRAVTPSERGHARRNLASLFRSGRGKFLLSRDWCSVSGKSPPQRRGLCPLRERRCA